MWLLGRALALIGKGIEPDREAQKAFKGHNRARGCRQAAKLLSLLAQLVG
ncbi:MAG TPA: hypothetical protein VL614_03730 [Acetobacteraceae bacterium]|jgi:hypothetical protein|nr:hypothetical protein [Acetobacteraceae bacterium]